MEQLAQAPEDELWLIADGSDLRKPYAQEMPALMQVRALRGPFGAGLSDPERAGGARLGGGASSIIGCSVVRKPALLVNQPKCNRP